MKEDLDKLKKFIREKKMDQTNFFEMDMKYFEALPEDEKKRAAREVLKNLVERDCDQSIDTLLVSDLIHLCEVAEIADEDTRHLNDMGLMSLAAGNIDTKFMVKAATHVARCKYCKELFDFHKEKIESLMLDAFSCIAERAEHEYTDEIYSDIFAIEESEFSQLSDTDKSKSAQAIVTNLLEDEFIQRIDPESMYILVIVCEYLDRDKGECLSETDIKEIAFGIPPINKLISGANHISKCSTCKAKFLEKNEISKKIMRDDLKHHMEYAAKQDSYDNGTSDKKKD
jgi:hypothetical protein